MNTLQRNNQVDNDWDLQGKEALEKLKHFIHQVSTCFFVTENLTPGSSGARPMTVRKVDDEGALWFLSAIDTHKDQELLKDPRVTLYFQDAENSDFLELRGRASISQDHAKIDELWDSELRDWFPEGPDDAGITVIKVLPETGHYWDTHGSRFANGVKMLLGSFLLQDPPSHVSEGSLDVR